MGGSEEGDSQLEDSDGDDESDSADQGDEDDEEYDEDEEEEDIEPSLKYERLGGDTAQLLEKDSACALAISDSGIVSTRLHPPTLLVTHCLTNSYLEPTTE